MPSSRPLQTMNMLGKKARDGTIGIDDMAGGTFTISNGGVYGSLLSTPIINPPQVRFLAPLQCAVLGAAAGLDRAGWAVGLVGFHGWLLNGGGGAPVESRHPPSTPAPQSHNRWLNTFPPRLPLTRHLPPSSPDNPPPPPHLRSS